MKDPVGKDCLLISNAIVKIHSYNINHLLPAMFWEVKSCVSIQAGKMPVPRVSCLIPYFIRHINSRKQSATAGYAPYVHLTGRHDALVIID